MMQNVKRAEGDLGFPPIGEYGIKGIHREGKWIQVSSGATNQDAYDFVLSNLGLLDSPSASLESSPCDKIDSTAINFFRLFEAGRSLMNIGPVKEINLDKRIVFPISSSRDLLEANLSLKNSAEKFISLALFPKQEGILNEVQRLRITQTKFLNPWALSEMTQGAISVEDALSIITCLGLGRGEEKIQVCDSLDGNFHSDFQGNMLTAKSKYKLVFLDPEDLMKQLCPTEYDPGKESVIATELFERTKGIVKIVLSCVKGSFPSLPLSVLHKLKHDLKEASVDHQKVRKIIDHIESYFLGQPEEKILRYKNAIIQVTREFFEACQKSVDELLSQEEFEAALKTIEAKARLNKASKQKQTLKEKFEEFRPTILSYLGELSREYKIEDPKNIEICWQVQGTEIIETMEITKTGSIARRVLCPGSLEGNRTDLVYFSASPNEQSVVSCWKSLCKENSLSDSQLVDYLLLLHEGKQIPDKLRPFLAFLMVLLLGKEPAYDSASFSANFILLLSVKHGVRSFEEALSRMPMIPQGAIAAKQFLLHVSGKPLDVCSRVQYKDKTQVPKSTFLPTSASFLGSANNWIQVYDNVATEAIKVCRRLFFKGIDPTNSDLVQLRTELQLLSRNDELTVWDIPLVLKTFSERKQLLNKPHRKDEILCILYQKNRSAARFLYSMGQSVPSVSDAAEQCVKFLTRGIDVKNPKIKELRRLIDVQNRGIWLGEILEDIKRQSKGIGLRQMLQKIVLKWDPVAEFQSRGINPDDPSYSEIIKMDRAWDDYFMKSMSAYQKMKGFDGLRTWMLNRYFTPVPSYELVAAIDPENFVNEKDPLAQWAISYLLDRHPLANF